MAATQEYRKPRTTSIDSAVSPTTHRFPKEVTAQQPASAQSQSQPPAQGPTQAIEASQVNQLPVEPNEKAQTERTASLSETRDRRDSDEWDASKVPPSRFQKRRGSIYAVPATRDGRVDGNYARKFHEKLAQMGYGEKK